MNPLRLMALTAALAAAMSVAAPLASHAEPVAGVQVLFVCEHGSAKSLLASLLFQQAAARKGLVARAVARGVAPDAAVPEWMREALANDGFEVGAWNPVAVSPNDLQVATRIVVFDVTLSPSPNVTVLQEHWDNLPPLSQDYDAGRIAIAARVETLAADLLREQAHDVDDAVRLPASGTEPLTVEARISLGNAQGRIDHLAFDPTRERLYVAELGNGTVGIIDLQTRRLLRTASGFDEPQGIAYEPSTDSVYVANGGDGSVEIFRGDDFAALGHVTLGGDADNVHIDRKARLVYVGYGAGALAVIDPATRTKVADIPLKGHPEGFQLDPAGTNIFVNVPDAGEIAVVARDVRRQIASWPTGKLRANYPMVLDDSRDEVIAIFRRPPRLERFQVHSGRRLAGTEVCADSDDVFVDPVRRRLYVICGDGFVDTFDTAGNDYLRVGRLPTSSGSRTGLYVAELDRLLVAIRASGKEPAAVWILRPSEHR